MRDDTDGAKPDRGARSLVIAARRVAGDPLVLQLIGPLDLASCRQVREAVDTWRDAEPVRLDLERVDFMDSTGLRLLIELTDPGERERPSITLAAPSDAVTRVVAVTGTAARLGLR